MVVEGELWCITVGVKLMVQEWKGKHLRQNHSVTGVVGSFHLYTGLDSSCILKLAHPRCLL